MTGILRSIASSRALLRDFVVRDLRSRYVGSSMGFFWSVIFPLINLVTFMFVFRLVLATRWSDDQGALEVSIVMLTGIIVWTGFAEAISRSTACIVDNANLVQKVVFPSAVFPAYITVSALANMCLGLPIVIGATLYFGHLSTPGVGLDLEPAAKGGVWEARAPSEAEPDWPHAFLALDRAWRQPTTVALEWSGTATRGEDYLAPHDVVEIPAGSARLYLPIIPLRDDVDEGTETVVVRITDAGGRDINVDSVTFDLNDSELEPAALAEEFDRDATPYTSRDSTDHHPLALGLPLLMLPVLIALLAIATVGIGAFFAAFNLYWRDTTHLIGVGLLMWMFGTPIFYPAGLVPAEFQFMLALNPMHWFIEMFRDVTIFALWPDPVHLVSFAVFAAIAFLLGGRFFQRHQPRFPDLL